MNAMYPLFSEASNRILDRSRARLDARVTKTGDARQDADFVRAAAHSVRHGMASFLAGERVDTTETANEILLRLELLVLRPDELSAIVREEAMRLSARQVLPTVSDD